MELVYDNFMSRQGVVGGTIQVVSAAAHEEPDVWVYNRSLLYGRIIQAVLRYRIKEGGWVLGPCDACTKKGRPFRDVMH